jgi:glycosyltransferase involved in cell wall biosynthesis
MDLIPRLSVVIIARNESKNIARAVESVLRGIEDWPQTQVLLVDSASTDETVDIARRYPISIVRLAPAWFLSASAGRYIGTRYTQGDLILFLDGDMELASGWLERAVPFILEHPEAAGVDGYFRNVHVRDGQVISEREALRDPQGNPVEVTYFCGAALYRRSALAQVGGFNPYLISEEEPELSMRLRHAGYKLIRLPYLISTHYGPPLNSWEYNVRRFRTRLWTGYGQVPRYHIKSGLLWTVLRQRNTYATIIYLAALLISVAVILFTFLSLKIWLLVIWALAASAVVVVFSIKKRSLRKTWQSLLFQGLVAYSAVRGFLMAPQPPASYPTSVEIVQ